MVSLKLFILVTFIATVACIPHHRVGHGGLHNGKGVTISGDLGIIFRGLKPSSRVCDSQTHQELCNTRRPKDMNDVITLLINLTQGVGGIMDNHYEGLGSLATRMVIVLARISLCKYGSHKFHTKHNFCSRDFPQFGVKGNVDNVDEMCNRFKVNDATKQVDDYINIYTKNKGIGSVKGTVKVFFQFCLNLAGLIDNRGSLNGDSFSELVIQVSIGFGAIANGYKYSHESLMLK